jgi:hypothetical protein
MSLALSHARAELVAQMESDDERASPAAFLTPTPTPTLTLTLTLPLTRCVARGLDDDDRRAGGAPRLGRSELRCGARRLGASQ